MGIVPSGHLPFKCHNWVIEALEVTLLSLKTPSGWKFGLIWNKKQQPFSSSEQKKKTQKKKQTWIVWFLRRGWSKAGWWAIWTQSITSPSGLCFFQSKTIFSSSWKKEAQNLKNWEVLWPWWTWDAVYWASSCGCELPATGGGGGGGGISRPPPSETEKPVLAGGAALEHPFQRILRGKSWRALWNRMG